MIAQTKNTSDLYALLVGINCYLPHKLPGGGYYPNLRGCVRDIAHTEDFLIHTLGMPSERILKLTSSTNPDGAEPSEPREQWPTYEIIVQKFKQLNDLARPGDQVYIHYSGHGGRAATIFPHLKGADGWDEALVPNDVGNAQARYLRDVELAYLLKQMVDKGLIVTILLDSCHSGGATRGLGGAVARGIRETDITARPADSLVASFEELEETWQGLSGSATRSLKTGSGWLLEPKGYTLLAACRASESAFEFAFDGQERNGALTYWWLDSLKQIGPNLNYRQVHDRILAKVHSQFEQQTPQLQGEGDRTVFGSDSVQAQFAALVLTVNDSEGKLLLNVGQAQPIRKGARFVVYPPGTQNFKLVDLRQALVEITELGSTDSWATVQKRFSQNAIEQGAPAVLFDPGSSRLRRTVCIVQRKDLPPTIPQYEALQEVQDAITKLDSGFLHLTSEDKPADFQVVVNEQNEFEIWDSAGSPLPNLEPGLLCREAGSAVCVAERLVHLAKYRNVQELDNRDRLSPLAGKLLVELVGHQANYDPADPPEPIPFVDPGHTPAIQDGEWIFLRIQNTWTPGLRNDPSRILNITVLDLQPDWGITQIYPSRASLFEPLDPGQEIVLPLKASLPEQYMQGKDTLKVFATTRTTNFRWLELPALDQPAIQTAKELATRGLADPLEELLASVTVLEPKTRNLDIASHPTSGWVTSQLEVRMIGEKGHVF